MKIITECVIDIETGRIIKESSFEYFGEVAECKGHSSTISNIEKDLMAKQTELLDQQVSQLAKQNELLDELYPTLEGYYKGQIEYSNLQTEAAKNLLPLQEELAKQGIELNTMQIESLKSETERNKNLEPLLLETMGYQKNEDGTYSTLETSEDPLATTLKEKYTSALENGTTSKALESQLSKEQSKLEEDLSRSLGPNWRTTTAGIQALEEFQQKADIVREETSQSATANLGSQYLSYSGLLSGQQQTKVNNLLSLIGGSSGVSGVSTGIGTSADTSGLLAGLSSGTSYSSASSGLSNMIDYYQTQRENKWAYEQGKTAGKKQSAMSGGISGATVGAQVGGPWGAAIGGVGGLLGGYLLG